MKKQEVIDYYIMHSRENGRFRSLKPDYNSVRADWKDFIENLRMDDCITEKQFQSLAGENLPCKEKDLDAFIEKLEEYQ